MSSPAHVEPLELPHAGAARLVAGVVRRSGETVECLARVPAVSPLLRDGKSPGWIALEIAAQAAMATGRPGEGRGTASVGYLVAVREAELLAPTIPIETDLIVTMRAEGSAPPLAVHGFELHHGRRLLARGILSTHAGS